MHRRNACLFGPAAGALLVAVSPASFAADQSSFLEEVLVTAERRETQLQTTPVAITALGAGDLQRLQIADMQDVAATAPSLAIEPNLASTSAITVSMRGNAEQNAAFLFSEPGVGLYVDGVYRRLSGASFDLLDVERVEVMRGPQGTLFGRNTLAGAMNIITFKPGQDVRGGFDLSYGSFDTARVRGNISGPLTDNLSGGIAAVYRDRSDGWMYDHISGQEVGTGDYAGGQAELRYTHGRFAADLRLFAGKNSTDGAYAAPASSSTASYVYKDQTDVAGAVVDTGTVFAKPYSENRQTQTDLTLTWQFESMTLRSITSYADMPDDDWAVDFTAAQQAAPPPTGPFSPVPGTSGFFRESRGEQSQFSEDLQLYGTSGSWDWTTGLYYYEESADQTIQDYFAGGFFAAVPAVHHLDADSIAAYAQVRYAFNDSFSSLVGGRYTEDSKDFKGNKANAAGVPTDFASSDSFGKFTGKLGLEYKVNQQVFTYFTFSQGFKSGTYDFFASAPGIATPLEPEVVDSYELGLKSELFDRTLRLNVALFDTTYEDLVVGTIVPEVGLISRNAGTERVTGLEAELTWRANDHLTVFGSLAALDPRWTELSPEARATGVELDDIPPLAYERQGSLGATWAQPVGKANIAINANVAYLGEHYQQVAHLNRESMRIPSRTTVDASINLAYGPHTVTLGGRNLGDNTDRIIASDFSTFLFNNTAAWTPAEALTWELTYRFDIR
jgi:iron complex outermembrane receptor protein